MSLIDFLRVDYELGVVNPDELSIRLRPNIVELDSNSFHLFLQGEGNVRHFKLELIAESLDLLEEGAEWQPADTSYYNSPPLPFHLTMYGEPTFEKFSQHIHRECSAALYALYNFSSKWEEGKFNLCWDRDSIQMIDVWVYLKLHNKSYERTLDFMRDYDYWANRLYQTQKWFHYLMGDLSAKESYDRWHFPVGEGLMDFISPFDCPQRVQEIRQTFNRS